MDFRWPPQPSSDATRRVRSTRPAPRLAGDGNRRPGIVLAGALAWWVLAAVRIVRFQRLLRDVEPMPAEWQAEIGELAGRMGSAASADGLPGAGRRPADALGDRRPPRLLVPARLWANLGDDERTSLVLHELAHLKRRDHWVRWLRAGRSPGLYWWHPAVWWARRAIARGRGAVLRRLGRLGDAPRGQDLRCRLVAALEFVSGVRTVPLRPQRRPRSATGMFPA